MGRPRVPGQWMCAGKEWCMVRENRLRGEYRGKDGKTLLEEIGSRLREQCDRVNRERWKEVVLAVKSLNGS